MKMKRIMMLITVIAVICSMAISVGAAFYTKEGYIEDKATHVQVAKVIYQLEYSESLNCARATQWISYFTDELEVNERNFYGETYLTVVLSDGSPKVLLGRGPITSNTNLAKQEVVFDRTMLPAGKTITDAYASFSTNVLEGNSAYSSLSEELTP